MEEPRQQDSFTDTRSSPFKRMLTRIISRRITGASAPVLLPSTYGAMHASLDVVAYHHMP